MSQQGPFPGGPVLPPQMPQQGGQQSGQLLNELQAEVSTEAAPLLQFLMKHAVNIMCTLGLFVLVLVGVGAYGYYTDKAEAEAQHELSKIMLSNQGQERIAQLRAFLPKAPDSMRLAITLDLAESAMEIEAYAEAATHFGSVAAQLEQDDPKSAMGLMAALNEGRALLMAKKPADALVVLEKLLPRVPEGYEMLVQEPLAEAALEAGDVAKAQKTFEAMAASLAPSEAAFYLYRAKHAEKYAQTGTTTETN